MRRVIAASMFFPRGGSAHIVRDTAQELPHHGWAVTIVSGSRTDAGHADARSFYRGLDVRSVDYTAAIRASGDVPEGEAPMHPSYEDRPGAPDRVFATVDDSELKRHVRAWARALDQAGAAESDVLCLHHLTPMNDAAARVAPGVPVVGHLHGTELLMLERIAAGAPASWTHAERWAGRMRRWAADCRRLLVAPGGLERAAGVLELSRDRFVAVPNGFDPDRFQPRRIDRSAHWRRHLVEHPRGAQPGGDAGTIAYREADIESFADGVVLTYVGRFTDVKRVPLLIRAHELARPRFRRPAPLVLIGGYPGECEGPHPLDVIAESGARDVFLAGWHDHDVLPEFLAASDAIVLPSVREQFGQALVEGMACGLPAVATGSIGAQSIVDDGQTGWLVPLDDVGALAEALICVVNDDVERRRRGREAREAVLARYSRPGVVERIAAVFDEVSGRPGPVPQAVEEAVEL